MSTRTLLAASALITLVACGGDPAIVSVVANPTTVMRGGTINMTVELENFTLGEGAAESGLTARGLRATHGEAVGGHIHTYLDDTETNPLAQTTELSYPVVISSSVAPGQHILIVRLHGADHLTLVPEVRATVDITVQ